MKKKITAFLIIFIIAWYFLNQYVKEKRVDDFLIDEKNKNIAYQVEQKCKFSLDVKKCKITNILNIMLKDMMLKDMRKRIKKDNNGTLKGN